MKSTGAWDKRERGESNGRETPQLQFHYYSTRKEISPSCPCVLKICIFQFPQKPCSYILGLSYLVVFNPGFDSCILQIHKTFWTPDNWSSTCLKQILIFTSTHLSKWFLMFSFSIVSQAETWDSPRFLPLPPLHSISGQVLSLCFHLRNVYSQSLLGITRSITI